MLKKDNASQANMSVWKERRTHMRMPKRFVYLAFLLGLCQIFNASQGSGQSALADITRQDIEAARQKVYPALVNISVVVRYFSGGRALRAPAVGSGVIINKDGYVLTNYHVAGNTTRITCTLPSGEALEAKVVLHDPMTDLSVLKLLLEKRANPNAPLPFASLGNSDEVKIGDTVLAMGNPVALASSMTLGIVSNTKRVFTDFTNTQIEEQELDGGEKTGIFTRWIQHDALILPGNSGGPLVNLKGEVIGINELGGNGMGFAIPSNIAAEVVQHAFKSDTVERGWLGLNALPVNRLNRDSGVLIEAISPGSPAEKAGLQPGDILLELDGKPANARFFEEVPLFYQAIAVLPINKPVSLKYLRGNETRTGTTTVQKMPNYRGKEEEVREMGISIQQITQPMALSLRLPNTDGVRITGVRPGYPFESAQPPLKEGDIILSIGETKITDLESFQKAIAEVNKETFPVTVRRKKEEILAIVKANEVKSEEENTELPKAWIGIKTQVVTPDVAKALKLENVKGFRVTEVMPLTEASKSGLKPGDIITMLNKDKLTASRPQDGEDLRRLVEDRSVGEKAELTVLREGKPQKIAVLLEGAPAGGDQAKKSKQKEFEFSVREIMPLDRIEKRLSREQSGVFVTEATPGGWASIAGLLVDDIILAINGQKIKDTASFEQVVKTLLEQRPKVVQIFLLRDHRTHFVFIEPDWQKLMQAR